jgi:hypothetical protein
LNRKRSYTIYTAYTVWWNYQSNALYTTKSKNAMGTVFENWIITKRCWKYENNIATPPDTFPAYRSSRVINVGSKKLFCCTEICVVAVMCSTKQCQTDPSILISSYHKRPGAPFLFPSRVVFYKCGSRVGKSCSRKQLKCITNYICVIKTNQKVDCTKYRCKWNVKKPSDLIILF